MDRLDLLAVQGTPDLLQILLISTFILLLQVRRTPWHRLPTRLSTFHFLEPPESALSFFIYNPVPSSKEVACNAGDVGSIPGLGRSLGERNSNPLQNSCLENPTDRGAWWATVRGVAKSRTRLSDSIKKKDRLSGLLGRKEQQFAISDKNLKQLLFDCVQWSEKVLFFFSLSSPKSFSHSAQHGEC